MATGRAEPTKAQEQRAVFIRCRTFGHAMDAIPAETIPEFGDPLWCRCMRCLTTRIDLIGTNGQVISRRYIYPEGYRDAFRHPGDEPPTRPEFRMMLLQQLIHEQRSRRNGGGKS